MKNGEVSRRNFGADKNVTAVCGQDGLKVSQELGYAGVAKLLSAAE